MKKKRSRIPEPKGTLQEVAARSKYGQELTKTARSLDYRLYVLETLLGRNKDFLKLRTLAYGALHPLPKEGNKERVEAGEIELLVHSLKPEPIYQKAVLNLANELLKIGKLELADIVYNTLLSPETELRSEITIQANLGKATCMLTQSNFSVDNEVSRHAEELVLGVISDDPTLAVSYDKEIFDTLLREYTFKVEGEQHSGGMLFLQGSYLLLQATKTAQGKRNFEEIKTKFAQAIEKSNCILDPALRLSGHYSIVRKKENLAEVVLSAIISYKKSENESETQVLEEVIPIVGKFEDNEIKKHLYGIIENNLTALAAKVDPTEKENVARCFTKLGTYATELNEKIHFYQLSIAISPTVTARHNLGYTLAKSGQLEGAEVVLGSLLEEKPSLKGTRKVYNHFFQKEGSDVL